MKNKNLLIIANSFPHKNCLYGGIFVKEQVDALAENFNKIYVIAPTPHLPEFFGRFEWIPSSWRKGINPINYSYKNIYVYFPNFFMLPINFSRKKAGERAYKASLKVISNENINFDIIHAHFTWYAGEIGAKLKEKYKKPFVLTVHEDRDWFLEEISSKDKKVFYSWKSADIIIRVNNIDLKELERIGIEKERLICITNAFADYFKPLDRIEIRKKLDLLINKKILLSVSVLEIYKGHEYLIKAMKKVVNEKRDILCFIIGSGQLKAKLQKLINDLNLNDYVKLIGAKPHDEIPLWMNACDLFVLSSLSEGNPTVMFECLGCGKPFVGTSVGGVPEIIINDNLGYLCEPKNPDKLAENILIALDRKWDKEYILNYAKKFSSDEIAKETFKIYEKVIDNGKGK